MTEKITKIIIDFKNKKFNIEEFQSRLHTLKLDDGYEDIAKILYEVDNQLEDIIYCKSAEYFYKYGVEVADSLVQKIEELKH